MFNFCWLIYSFWQTFIEINIRLTILLLPFFYCLDIIAIKLSNSIKLIISSIYTKIRKLWWLINVKCQNGCHQVPLRAVHFPVMIFLRNDLSLSYILTNIIRNWNVNLHLSSQYRFIHFFIVTIVIACFTFINSVIQFS